MISTLSPRERLLTTLRGGIPDRVPVSPFVQEEYLRIAYPDRKEPDRVIDATDLAEELDFDLIAKHRTLETPYFLRKSHKNWTVRTSTRKTNGVVYFRTEIDVPGRHLIAEECAPESAGPGVHPSVSKHLLAEPDDRKAFLDYLPELDSESIQEMAATATRWRSIIGDRGILAPWGWAGAFNAAATLRGIEQLMLDPFDEPDMHHAFMNRLTDAMVDTCRALASTEVDCVGIQAHMANSRTVSPAYFREFVFPYEKRVIDAIHEAGAFSILHNCGCASTLYELYRELGMSVWETVSEPPQGDNSLAEAKRSLGKHMVLLGNLDQVRFLKTASPSEVAARTREILRVGMPGGRFIFSTSDFLEKGTPRENVVAMLDAAREAYY